jgi:hypothetical protein
MPLHDVTHGNEYLVAPGTMDANPFIEALRRKLPPASFQRLLKTVDEAIENSIQGHGQLTWTKAGALFGHHSMEPKHRVDHLWEKVIAIVGEGKECLKTVGALLRWRMSIREEDWLVYRRETEGEDEDTGEVIRISEYWIRTDAKE